MRGIRQEAGSRGYVLLLLNMHAHSALAELALRTMRGRVDGLLVMPPHLDREELEQALPANQPAILLNPSTTLASHSSIRLDNRSGMTAVVEHLVQGGCRRLVHIRGPVGNIDAE